MHRCQLLTSPGGCTALPRQSWVDSCSEEASSEVISLAVSAFQAESLPPIFARIRIVAQGVCCSRAAGPRRLRLAARAVPAFASGDLPECRTSLPVKTCRDWISHRGFIEADERRASALRTAGRSVCVPCSHLACLDCVPPLSGVQSELQEWKLPPARTVTLCRLVLTKVQSNSFQNVLLS